MTSEADGPIENPLPLLSWGDSFEIEVGLVDACPEELGLEISAPGEFDGDRARP